MADIYKELLKTAASMDTDSSPATTSAVKAIELESRRQQKLSTLGQLNQGADLTKDSYSVTPQGTIESNANKIWNDMTSADVQGMVSDAASDYQIYKDTDGKWYQGTGSGKREYTGDFSDTQRAYMYGTKEDENAVKFGLARGDLPSSDYRYQPGRAEAEGYGAGKRGYGWEAGEAGVDLNKKYMDILLPKNVATALEAAVHGRSGALENRMYPDYMSDEAVKHASGVSEYYTSPEGVFGDTSMLSAEELASTGKLKEYSKLPQAQSTYKPTVKAGATDMESYLKSGSKLSYEDWASRGDQRDSNTIDALQVGATRWWGKTQEAAGELLKSLAEQDKEFLGKEDARLKEKYNESVSEFRKSFNEGIKEAGEYLTKRGEFIKDNASEYYGYNDAGSKAAKAVWGELKQGNVVKALENVSTEGVLGLVAESLPEMAMYYNPTTLLTSYAGNVAEAKKEAEEVAGGNISTGRMSAILIGEGLSLALDKAVFDGIISPAKAGDVIEKAAEKLAGTVPNVLLSASVKYATDKVARVAGAVAAEGTQEVLQEGQRIATTQLGQRDALTEENLDRLGESLVGGGLAGGAMRGGIETISTAGDMLRGPSSELQAQRLEELKSKTRDEVKSNMESNLDMTGSVELGEVDKEIESTLGVDSISRMYNDSGNVDEMLAKMNEAKKQILADVYEYDEATDKFTGVKDVSKLDKVEKWFEDYGTYQADATGKIPEDIQNEIDYIKRANQTFKTAETVGESVKNMVKDELGTMEGLSEEEKINNINKQIDDVVNMYKFDEKVPGAREVITRKVRQAYELSGMAGLGKGINLEIDKDALESQVKETAGIKAGAAGQRLTSRGGKVVEVGSVTNEELMSMLSGEGTSFPADHPNTKFRNTVVKKLDPQEAFNVTSALTEVGSKMNEAADRNIGEAGRYFKGGDVKGNMVRLMTVVANAINSQVESDTDLRSNTTGSDSSLRSGEYWAGLNNVLEQAGKDYASTYGLRLTGKDKVALAKAHRDLGRFGVKLLEDAGMVEITNDNMWSVAGETVGADGRQISTLNTKGVRISKGKDTLTDENVTLVMDKGIRLIDSIKEVGARPNDEPVSRYGDAIKRVAKVMLPNASRVPATEYVDRNIKHDEDIEIDEITTEILKRKMKTPFIMKGGVFGKVLEYLRGINDKDELRAEIKKSAELRRFLGLEESGSELLKVNDKGSTMSKFDNLVGILDNLDTLSNPEGVYYTFQVDINDRFTVMETIANYQSDKVYARALMAIGTYRTKTKEGKDILVYSLADELKSRNDKGMSDLEAVLKYADIYKQIEELANGDTRNLIEIIANTTKEGKALAHLKGLGGIRILSLLEGAKDIQKAMKPDGTLGDVVTEYIPEKDASASGVFNVTMNIAGRNAEFSKQRLMELGVTFGDEGAKETRDAYKILGDLIKKMLDKTVEVDESIGLPKGGEDLAAVRRINDALADDKLMRQLAKYPIMTWFYSAREKSIKENLTSEMTQVLVERALEGDTGVLKYLSDVMGREITADNVKYIKKGDKDHKALRKELNKIGSVYYSYLQEAFPEVQETKDEMAEYFEFLTKNSVIDGKDYWEGRVRTGLGAVHGTNTTMSLYKWKNQAIDMSEQEKIDRGLATKDEAASLITIRNRMPNETSLMALLAHNADAAEAAAMLDGVSDDVAVQSKHDGFSSSPDELIKGQKKAEKAAKEVALKYDFIEEMAWTMEQTANRMEEALADATPEVKKKLEVAMKKLDDKVAAIREKNKPRLEAKAELLKDAETSLFGKEGYVKQEEVAVEEEVKTPEAVKEEAVEKVYESILDVITDMDTADERKVDILANKENVKIVTVNAEVEVMLRKKGNKSINEFLKNSGSFTYNGTVYIGKKLMKGIDEVSGKRVTAEQILDTVAHEIEHAMADKYISKEHNGEIKAEYDKIVSILEKASMSDRVPRMSPRARSRMEYVIDMTLAGNKMQAVKELVAISREDTVFAEVMENLNKMAGIQGNFVERMIKKIWNKVQELMAKTPVKELLKDTDVYSLGIAIKSIQDKARGIEDKGIGKANDGTITDKNSNPFDEDFVSGLTENIDPIC